MEAGGEFFGLELGSAYAIAAVKSGFLQRHLIRGKFCVNTSELAPC
jgi:hypothetical protein